MADLYRSLFTNIFLLDMFIFLMISMGSIVLSTLLLRAATELYYLISAPSKRRARKFANLVENLRSDIRSNNSVMVCLVLAHVCLCLISVGIFLYYVARVTSAEPTVDGSDPTANIFNHTVLLWLECIISGIFTATLLIEYLESNYTLLYFMDLFVWIILVRSHMTTCHDIIE